MLSPASCCKVKVVIPIRLISVAANDFGGTGRSFIIYGGFPNIPPVEGVGGKKDQSCWNPTCPILLLSGKISYHQRCLATLMLLCPFGTHARSSQHACVLGRPNFPPMAAVGRKKDPTSWNPLREDKSPPEVSGGTYALPSIQNTCTLIPACICIGEAQLSPCWKKEGSGILKSNMPDPFANREDKPPPGVSGNAYAPLPIQNTVVPACMQIGVARKSSFGQQLSKVGDQFYLGTA